jgi:WXG100 family type VII secretion target
MSELRVGTESVRDAGARAHSLVSEFADALSQCNATAAALVNGSWTGPASSQFASGWAEWLRGAQEVHDALAGIATLLAESATQYESTESSVTQVSSESSVVVGGTS